MSNQILGLPLSADIPSSLMPYSVAAVVKALDGDGDEVYAVLHSDNMTELELVGMSRFISIYAEKKLGRSIDDTLDSTAQ